LQKGDEFSIEWLPRDGTLIRINAMPAGPVVAEPAFFVALMKIWLGKAPADADLKQALLGGGPDSVQERHGAGRR
jgi:hypothetical protein